MNGGDWMMLTALCVSIAFCVAILWGNAKMTADTVAPAVKASPEPVRMTKAQLNALIWLYRHGSDGCFDKHGVAFAQGESAPATRSTWNALQGSGLLEFYGGRSRGGVGYGRLRLTPLGVTVARDKARD